MLYKFKSKSTADLIMLEPSGRQILQIMGREPSPEGILLPESMAAAITALQAAVRQDEAQKQSRIDEAVAQGLVPEHTEGISLSQRAQPFLDMLRRCEKAGHEVVWGV